MTPGQILSAWERALLIFAEENHNAHCVFSAATPTSDGIRLVLTYAKPTTKIEVFNVETATRRHLELTLNDGFLRGCEELKIPAARVPEIVIVVAGADDHEPELEKVTSELPPHDAAPAAVEFTKAQRAAAAAYNIAQLGGVMLARFAETDPDAVIELAREIDTYAERKRPDTSTGYSPTVERRIALFFAKLAP